LDNGQLYRSNAERVSRLNFKEYIISLDLMSLGADDGLGRVRAKEMPVSRLRVRAAGLEENMRPDWIHKARAELVKRHVFPVSCLVLGLFAIPLAASFTGTRQHVGILLTLGMFLVHFSLFAYTNRLAEFGQLNPNLLWASNALFLALTLPGLYLAAQERPPQLNLPWHWLKRLSGRSQDA
jgi:lipopolysaccharide export system permease protein